jgi:hypothetical protein
MKLYERDVDFVNNGTIALLNEEMTKIKVVDLAELYNFVVENFSFELIYCFKMCFEVVIF